MLLHNTRKACLVFGIVSLVKKESSHQLSSLTLHSDSPSQPSRWSQGRRCWALVPSRGRRCPAALDRPPAGSWWWPCWAASWGVCSSAVCSSPQAPPSCAGSPWWSCRAGRPCRNRSVPALRSPCWHAGSGKWLWRAAVLFEKNNVLVTHKEHKQMFLIKCKISPLIRFEQGFLATAAVRL